MQSDWLSEGIPDGQFYHIRSCRPRCNAIQTDNATNHDVINCDNVTRMILSLVTIFCQNNNRRWSTRKDIGNWWQNYCSGLTLSFQQQGTFFWSNHSKLHSIYCWQLSLTSLSGRLKYVIKHQLRLERQRFFKAQCTAGNWTELNSTELFSSVQFPAVHWTGDEIGGRRRFVDGRRRFLAVKNLRRPSPIVAARRRFNAQRKTELNSTELNRTIQLSWVEFSAVHWA